MASFIGCGRCWYCEQGLFSLCDNSNPAPGITDVFWGESIGGCFGCSHAMGGYAGSHAEYVRVLFADHGAFAVPEEVSDERALFASDAAPTGWMGADLGGVRPGDTVAVWGAGAVGKRATGASRTSSTAASGPCSGPDRPAERRFGRARFRPPGRCERAGGAPEHGSTELGQTARLQSLGERP